MHDEHTWLGYLCYCCCIVGFHCNKFVIKILYLLLSLVMLLIALALEPVFVLIHGMLCFGFCRKLGPRYHASGIIRLHAYSTHASTGSEAFGTYVGTTTYHVTDINFWYPVSLLSVVSLRRPPFERMFDGMDRFRYKYKSEMVDAVVGMTAEQAKRLRVQHDMHCPYYLRRTDDA